MRSKIFIQIASYRDPELLPTIRDCIKKAKYPDRLTFGICWQRDEEESLEEFAEDSRFQIDEHMWKESKGLCWARSRIQPLYRGEKYTLQLDSHHRFLQNWDEILIKMMKQTGAKKPIITTYAGMYSPVTNKVLNVEPYKMVASEFTKGPTGGTILFRPHHIPGWEKLTQPIPARFVSGHFFFTLGIHCKEYKYDPNIYFAGDEISLSIRSYTLGYDLFHPHKTVVWHEYTREGRTKHWTDFNKENKDKGIVKEEWYAMDLASKRRLRHMLQEEYHEDIELGEYGLGTVRSHREYELYAGISFSKRKLHKDTLAGIDPPTNDPTNWYDRLSESYKIKLDWSPHKRDIVEQITDEDEFDFLYVGVESESGNVLQRFDLTDYNYLTAKETTVTAEFESIEKPYKYVIWPHAKNAHWLNRVDVLI